MCWDWIFFIKTKQSEIKYADCTSISVAMDFFPSGLKLKFTQLTVWHVQGEVRREGRGGVEVFLRNIHEGSDEHLVEDSVVERAVFESFVTLSVPEREGVGNRAAQELGSDVRVGIILLLHLGVLQGQ